MFHCIKGIQLNTEISVESHFILKNWITLCCKSWGFHYSDWTMPFSGMWRHVVIVLTDISQERIASIFGVEKSSSKEPA
jgi:hypothetical protein